MDQVGLFLMMAMALYGVQTITAAQYNSNQIQTQIYTSWKAGSFDGTLFLPNTYLPQTFDLDSEWGCMVLTETETSSIRAQYLAYLSRNGITCGGTWCQRGNFECLPRGTLDCYQVEHIIDQNTCDPDLDQYEKNILGNLV